MSPLQTLKQAATEFSAYMRYLRWIYGPPCHGLFQMVRTNRLRTGSVCCSPDYTSVGREHTFREWRAVVRTERAGRMDLVTKAGEKDLAFAFESDLLPVDRVSTHVRCFRVARTDIWPSLSSLSLSTAMVLDDILRNGVRAGWGNLRASSGRRLRTANMRTRAEPGTLSVSRSRDRRRLVRMMSVALDSHAMG